MLKEARPWLIGCEHWTGGMRDMMKDLDEHWGTILRPTAAFAQMPRSRGSAGKHPIIGNPIH
ncbi:hypothetical protein IP76_15500 [Rhizobium sp. AAP43]|nr:hypothetical protein IP76_15500 [Rhizobium sp. AAP43]